MRGRARQTEEEPGQDAFLDIVANLVGILIILVMIVGAQAKNVLSEAETSAGAEKHETVKESDVEAERDTLASVESELQSILEKANRQQREIAYRRLERDRILEMVTEAENQLERKRESLSEEQQDAHDLQSSIFAAKDQYNDLKMSLQAVTRGTPSVQIVKHRPTPLAKTVFGQEVHFRLKAGRLAYVPLDELVEQLKTQARQKAWKLRQAPAVTETVGPIRGFRLKYTLKKTTRDVQTRSGTASQQRVELDHFVLVPVRDDLGEPLEHALEPQSRFRSMLSSRNPDESTVTVWVYPDSFDQYQPLKEELYQLGFLAAGRPMPAGTPISGSPDGVRSAAQ
ncbi:MAG: hypothetical protein ACODAD_02550 [Planctomycetota bacterium]